MESKKLRLFLETVKKINELLLQKLIIEATVSPVNGPATKYHLTVYCRSGNGNRTLDFFSFDSYKKMDQCLKTALAMIKQDNFQIIKNNFSEIRDSVN